ncbi:uncharacterized protein LOC132204420 isoform X1 [Neocloeon triangulifer]|uniref:uncharacterized protein LOC132204420 isoform X1 n=1 Tax=Neocloeon triangulifer TaxID=2078957 RepID=UPI00286F069D|nr:uncharacterized protein LOC132204420 isoform X1 [Neocloeon triangulifer]XP_059488899.1 uncharacterized protein LOC132204420 isoform X1 [Neocloeon triangulifer]
MMISSLKIIFLSIIISLILVELTASRVAGFCDPEILRNGNDKRLQCNFEKGRANYNTGDVGECKCNGRDCYELPHANFVCGSDSNWYFEDNNSTSDAWGVECKDENSCPRCSIPKTDYSNCYKSKEKSKYVCICKHDKREYSLECLHSGKMYIWSSKADVKCEKLKLPHYNTSMDGTTKEFIISTSGTTRQPSKATESVIEPNQNQNMTTQMSQPEDQITERFNNISSNETTQAPLTLSTTEYPTTAEKSTTTSIEPNQPTSAPPENEKKEWYVDSTYIILGSILVFIALCAVAFAIFVMIKRRRPARPIIL